jgi:hypothetical protein
MREQRGNDSWRNGQTDRRRGKFIHNSRDPCQVAGVQSIVRAPKRKEWRRRWGQLPSDIRETEWGRCCPRGADLL